MRASSTLLARRAWKVPSIDTEPPRSLSSTLARAVLVRSMVCCVVCSVTVIFSSPSVAA